MAASEAAIEACLDCRDSPKEWCVCTDADLVGNYLILARSHRHIGFLWQYGSQAPRLSEARQRQWRAQAAASFRTSASYYLEALAVSKNPRLEETLVGLADLYFIDLKELDLATARYEELIRVVPKATALPHAYLALGEIRFAKGNWRGAEVCYDKAAASDDVGSAACATYKKAWTLLRRGYPHLARKAFKTCQEQTQRRADLGEIRDACLGDERSVNRSGR